MRDCFRFIHRPATQPVPSTRRTLMGIPHHPHPSRSSTGKHKPPSSSDHSPSSTLRYGVLVAL